MKASRFSDAKKAFIIERRTKIVLILVYHQTMCVVHFWTGELAPFLTGHLGLNQGA